MRKAAAVLADFREYKLSGTCMIAYGRDLTDINIRDCSAPTVQPIPVPPTIMPITFGVKATLKSGETEVFVIGHETHKITALLHVEEGKPFVTIIANGEHSTQLSSQQQDPYGRFTYTFASGAKVAVLDFDLEQREIKFVYQVGGQPRDVEPEPVGVEPRPVVPEPSVLPVEVPEDCEGCVTDHSCLANGIRLVEGEQPVYCGTDDRFHPQRGDGRQCQNDYECLSNTCGNGVCQDFEQRLAALEQEVEETKSLIAQLFAWLSRLFN